MFIILVVSYLKNVILNFFRNLCRVKFKFFYKFFLGIFLVDNKGWNIEFWINFEFLLWCYINKRIFLNLCLNLVIKFKRIRYDLKLYVCDKGILIEI